MLPTKLCSLVLLLVASSVEFSLRVPGLAGPFRIDFKKFERCPPGWKGPNAVSYYYEIRTEPNEPTLYSANASAPFTFDDNLLFKGSLASWSNTGGWKPNAYQVSLKNLCKMGNQHFKAQMEYGMNFFFGEVLQCPFLPALYRAYNFSMPKHLMVAPRGMFSQFVYGRWRAEGKMITPDGETVACGRAYVDTVPK